MQPDKMNFWNVLIQQLVELTAKEEKDVIPQPDNSDDKEKGTRNKLRLIYKG